MKKVLSITLSLIIIVTACLGFGTVALANNYSSAQAIQEELNKNKFNSSTPLTVTATRNIQFKRKACNLFKHNL